MDRLGAFLGEIFPIVTLVVGAILGNQSAARLAAEQQFEDQRQRWRERRQDLLTRIQRQAHTSSEEAGTAITMRNRPELNPSATFVDREAPWVLRWNDARKDFINSAELLGDAEVQARVQEFVNFQDEIASSRLVPKQINGQTLSVIDELREKILSLEEPLTRVTSLVAERYRELEGPEPTFKKQPW